MYIIVSTRTVCTMAWISGFSISGRLEPTQKLRLDRSCGFGNGFQAVHKPSRVVGPAYCSRFAVNRAAATLACRLIATVIKTCKVARHLCFVKHIDTSAFLSDVYLENIINLLWTSWKDAVGILVS
jgi:hypothetical protein